MTELALPVLGPLAWIDVALSAVNRVAVGAGGGWPSVDGGAHRLLPQRRDELLVVNGRDSLQDRITARGRAAPCRG